jgi:acetyl esterase
VTGPERVAALVARSLGALPPALVRLLAGRTEVVDGQALEPEVKLARRIVGPRDGRRESLGLAQRRARTERDARVLRGRAVAVAAVRDLAVKGGAGDLVARLYTGEGAPRPSALLVYFHGGGWTTGSLATHDNLCRFLATEARIRVLSVEYRLAPEHRFPAAVEDALASLRDAATRAGELGALPGRVAVGGDSAGGNLAAACAQLARGADVQPALQLLIYPVLQVGDRSRRSYELFSDGYYLTRADMDFYDASYLADPKQASDPRASPLLTQDLAGLAPALVVVAGFDPLRDEALEYAGRLEAAGVRVHLERVSGLPHAFANVVTVGRAAPGAMRRVAAALREMLGAQTALG